MAEKYNLNPTESEVDAKIFRVIAAHSKALSKPTPEMQAIFDKAYPPPFLPTKEQIHVARKGMARSIAYFMKSPFVRQTLASIPGPDCSAREISINTEPNVRIALRIYTPGGPHKTGLPVLVMAHSGGFCTGDLNTEEFICRLLCRRLNLIVVDCNYRLTPESSLSEARNDVFATVRWVSQNAASVGGDLSKGFLVGGASAGGCHMLPALYRARDEELRPSISGVLIICTGQVYNLKEETRSRMLYPGRLFSHIENRDAPFSSQAANECYSRIADTSMDDPDITQLYRANHETLPPMYSQIAGMDLLRDGTILYQHLYQKAGNMVRSDMYPGLPHMWWVFYSQIEVATQKWGRDLVAGTQWLLQDKAGRGLRSQL